MVAKRLAKWLMRAASKNAGPCGSLAAYSTIIFSNFSREYWYPYRQLFHRYEASCVIPNLKIMGCQRSRRSLVTDMACWSIFPAVDLGLGKRQVKHGSFSMFSKTSLERGSAIRSSYSQTFKPPRPHVEQGIRETCSTRGWFCLVPGGSFLEVPVSL